MLGEPYASGWLTSWYNFPANLVGAIKSAMWNSFFIYDTLSTYNSVLWTMEKEFYGSLFLFAFLGLLGNRRSRILFYPLITFLSYKLYITWLNAFVFGIALCDLYINYNRIYFFKNLGENCLVIRLRGHYVSGAFWIVLVAGAGLPNYKGISYLILGVVAIALTIVSTWSQRILSHPWLLFMGRISFGLYLVHLPIICSFSCWAYLTSVARIGHTGAALISSILTCIISIICGYFLYIVADRPAIRISRLFSSLTMNSPITLVGNPLPTPRRTNHPD